MAARVAFLGWLCLALACGDDDDGFAGEPLDTGVSDDALVSELEGADMVLFCLALTDYLEAVRDPDSVPFQCWAAAWANSMGGGSRTCEEVVEECRTAFRPQDPQNMCAGLELQFCNLTVGQFERCAPVASYTTQISNDLTRGVSCANIQSFQSTLSSGAMVAPNPGFGPEVMECFGAPGTCLAQFFF